MKKKSPFLISIFAFIFFNSYSQPGSLDKSFDPKFAGTVGIHSIVVQPDGKILSKGFYTTSVSPTGGLIGAMMTYSGTMKNRVTLLNIDGSIDTVFHPGRGANKAVYVTSVQDDGKTLIGGRFTAYNGKERNYIARIFQDGSLDTSFNSKTGPNESVDAIAVQSDGRILIGGEFSVNNQVLRNRIARLNTDGSLDTSFNPGKKGINKTPLSIAIQNDGKILIGGNFTSYNGISRKGIVRLNANGSLDTGFDPGTGVNGSVRTVTLQPDGKILISGSFSLYNEISRNGIVRLNEDGSIDMDFNPGTGTDGAIESMAVQRDGKILIVGGFTFYNGRKREGGIVRLNSNGSLDTKFNTGTGANEVITYVAIQHDGKILVCGQFTSFNGEDRKFVARIND